MGFCGVADKALAWYSPKQSSQIAMRNDNDVERLILGSCLRCSQECSQYPLIPPDSVPNQNAISVLPKSVARLSLALICKPIENQLLTSPSA